MFGSVKGISFCSICSILQVLDEMASFVFDQCIVPDKVEVVVVKCMRLGM